MKGFSLIEMMIVICMIAILGAIAYPSYQSQVQQARRAEAKKALLAAAQAMENYYSLNGMTYLGASITGIAGSSKIPKDGADHFYTMAVSSSRSSYELTAIPVGNQAADPCGTLSFNRNGIRTAAESYCW